MADRIDGIENIVFDSNNEERRSWIIFGKRIPRSEIVFLCQIVLIFFIVIRTTLQKNHIPNQNNYVWDKLHEKFETEIQKRPTVQETKKIEPVKRDIITRFEEDLKGTQTDIKKSKKILDKINENPRVDISIDETILLDDTDTKIPIVDFLNKLQRKSGAVPEIYNTILTILNVPNDLFKSTNAKSKNTEGWRYFGI